MDVGGNERNHFLGARIAEAEAWKPVPGYEELYEVSSYGRVRRLKGCKMAPAGYELKVRLDIDGYPRYSLWKRGSYRAFKAHRLVALAFLGAPPFAGAHVAHFDGNKLNNHTSNLRWATPAENEADKKRHGRTRGAKPGAEHHGAKLNPALVMQLRHSVQAGQSIKAVARTFGIPYLTVYDAVVGNTWNCVVDPHPIAKVRSI